MLYVLLIIIIGLLIKLIYFPRDKGVEAQAHWNKLFSRKVHIPEYRKGDPRNETHPEEMVKMKDGSLSHRKLAMLLEATEEKTPTVDDLDGDQKGMSKHLSDYRKRTGKQMPTYDEMLKMNEDELRTWTLYRIQKENREKLLEEMITHEEKTSSLRKTVRKKITAGEQAVLNVFDRNKSSGTVDALRKMGKILLEDDKEEKDFVMDAIFAKITSDSIGLGDKMEKERNT
jgi:hypothetical protein